VAHVCLYEMAGGECTAERQLTSEDTSCDDTGEAARVLARVGGVGTADAKHVEHCCLWLEDCTATNRTNLDTWHRDRDLKIAVHTGLCQHLCIAEGTILLTSS